MNLFFKYTLLTFTFLFVNNSLCLQEPPTQQNNPAEIIAKGFLLASGGIVLTSFGILRMLNIPLTAQQEIAFALQDRLNKENLKKLYLGRKITSSFLIGSGLFFTLIGILGMRFGVAAAIAKEKITQQ